MARTERQIFKELNTFFNPSAKVLKSNLKGIKKGTRNEIRKAKRERNIELDNITDRAVSRGALYSGIPIEEEAKLAGSFGTLKEDIRGRGAEARSSLAGALADLRKQQGLTAIQIREGEISREDARRQAAAARAAAASQAANFGSLANLLGGGGGGGGNSKNKVKDSGARLKYKNGTDGSQGFKFTNGQGKPISAFEYAKLTGTPFFQVLRNMADEGDDFAGQALKSISGPGFSASQQSAFAPLFPASPGGGVSLGSLLGNRIKGEL